MPVETLSCIPRQFTSGDTVIFTEGFAQYPVSGWTLKFILSIGVAAPAIFDATISGTDFLVTISASDSAKIASGVYAYAMKVTETASGQVAMAKTGSINVLPNLSVAQIASDAQLIVDALNKSIRKLALGTSITVSFNGQTFTKKDIQKLVEQRTFFQAEVIRENEQLAAMRGEGQSTRIPIAFVPTYNVNPTHFEGP